MRLSGGRTWWAHFEFTRINIEPIILRKKIEEQLILGAFNASSTATWSQEGSTEFQPSGATIPALQASEDLDGRQRLGRR